METKYTSFPSAVIPTDLGEVLIALTDGGHAHVSAGGSSAPPALKFRGGEFYLSLHVNLYADGWHLTRDDRGTTGSTSVFLHRADKPYPQSEHVAPTHRALIIGQVLTAARLWLGAHPEVVARAAAKAAEDAKGAAEKKVEELEAQLKEARAAAKKARIEHQLAVEAEAALPKKA